MEVTSTLVLPTTEQIHACAWGLIPCSNANKTKNIKFYLHTLKKPYVLSLNVKFWGKKCPALLV